MISKKGISKQMRRANWKREVLERAAQKKIQRIPVDKAEGSGGF